MFYWLEKKIQLESINMGGELCLNLSAQVILTLKAHSVYGSLELQSFKYLTNIQSLEMFNMTKAHGA